MSLRIDTGLPPRPATLSALVQGDGRPDFRDFGRCERMSRKIVSALYACETPADLDAYEAEEGLILDGLYLAWPDLSATIAEAIDTQRACLTASAPRHSATADPTPAVPASPTPLMGNMAKASIMLDFDTGSSGSEGPWISWSARGTQDGAIPPQSFYLRTTDGKLKFDGFTSGVILDVEGMKTGWQRSEGIAGQAPDWRWNASVSRFEASPGEDYKKGFQIKCAIGSGLTATWEQAGAAAWNGFCGLVPALQSKPAGDVLPLVRITGTKAQKFARGSTVEPVLEVVKWVPRPACLKDGVAAGIATAPAAAPVQPAPQPAMAGGDDEPTEF